MSEWIDEFRRRQVATPDPKAEERDREQEVGGSLGGVWFNGPELNGLEAVYRFLEARIAEDEHVARQHQGLGLERGGWTDEHVARHLAECAVKRAILGLWRDQQIDEDAACYLALVYRDHPDFPDYLKEWRDVTP